MHLIKVNTVFYCLEIIYFVIQRNRFIKFFILISLKYKIFWLTLQPSFKYFGVS